MTPKPPKGQFTVLYFASAGSYTAREHDYFTAPLPISKLFGTLEEKHSGIQAKILDSCLVTVNLEYVDIPEKDDDPEQVVIKEGDEVAIIPPVNVLLLFHLCTAACLQRPKPPARRNANAFLITRTRSNKSRKKAIVEAMLTSAVKVVMVETWHPNGRVRISHRSAQFGQTSSSQAGAKSGNAFGFGTHVQDYGRRC
ncbi:hypothetical protein JX266_002528 [Neoarthrinium moseri]|nr:hypothetical protein JX266_002528 [Neoarthrinium moseri]